MGTTLSYYWYGPDTRIQLNQPNKSEETVSENSPLAVANNKSATNNDDNQAHVLLQNQSNNLGNDIVTGTSSSVGTIQHTIVTGTSK